MVRGSGPPDQGFWLDVFRLTSESMARWGVGE